MAEAYIIDSVRTPRGGGKPGKGALSHLHPQHLGATVLKALAERNDLNTAEIDDIIWGTNVQVGKQSMDLGRMSALDADYDLRSSGVTLDRFCGSGITTVSLAAAQVMSGMEDLVIAGGCEMMSYTATLFDMTNPNLIDAGNLSLREKHPQGQQGVCADAIATLEGIDRQAVDELAVTSQQRAATAIQEGRFEKSIVPVKNPDGSMALDHDEHPRAGTTVETLGELQTVFDKVASFPVGNNDFTWGELIYQKYPELQGNMNHVHHAGNSSGVVDGAAALLLASESYVEKSGMKPRARVVATANMGDCPTLMLNAPVPAAKKVLAKAGLTTDDIEVYEINEAFATVAEKFIRDLHLDRSKVNINGGAIALGHPIGATGSVLIGTALDELERSGGRYGLITMCAGGGMAPAIIIEQL
ncbi:MAG: acetyl-CoA C-acetyltransferase [Pseudomonadota bacterium]